MCYHTWSSCGLELLIECHTDMDARPVKSHSKSCIECVCQRCPTERAQRKEPLGRTRQRGYASLHPAVFCFSPLLKSAQMRLTAAVFRKSGLRNKRLNSSKNMFNLLGCWAVPLPTRFIHSGLLPAVYTVNGLKL